MRLAMRTRLTWHPQGGSFAKFLPATILLLACPLRADDTPPEATLPPPADRQIDFVRDVRTIFEAHCYSCHGPRRQQSDYRLDSRTVAIAGGQLGAAIVPGDSAASSLVRYVAGLEPEMLMPAEGDPLSAEQIGVLRAWIDQGAQWPDETDSSAETAKGHWAWQPLAAAQPPEVSDASWIKNPIDSFVLATLDQKGMRPSPAADKRTLLRRVSFDLIGLAPTPEELDAFIADSSPDAFEKVVDRLLASPRYGERWARHWMDVIHFAETHGHDQDRERPHAWPFRDYLIESFNLDKPYGRFIEEQVAGDILFPDDPQAIVATGFLAAGPWDESSQLNIVDDTVDKQIARNLDRDDMVVTTMNTFTGMTVQCARCHNHKFDPITQDEYYGLQAAFAGIDRANRTYEPDAQAAVRRRELTDRIARLAQSGPCDAELSAPTVPDLVASFTSAAAIRLQKWRPASGTWKSGGGATVSPRPDGSVVFGDKLPDKESTLLALDPAPQGARAFRLELLTDPSLPHQGPGRRENGNLHVTDIRLEISTAAEPDKKRKLSFVRATADFDQEGWTAAHAIDENSTSGWGIHPSVGQAHEVVFELSEPLVVASGEVVTLVIDQQHGTGHVIGRVRCTCTSEPLIAGDLPMPTDVARVAALAPEMRTAQDALVLARHVVKADLSSQLASVPPPRQVYAAASDFKPEGNFTPAKGPRPVFVLRRGDVTQPMDAAAPQALACVPGLASRFELAQADNEGARRAAMAHWLSHRDNALTWRTIANRVWHYHFGRGLVETPSDLGTMGGTPSHPELIDWLAVWLRDQGGSLKALHRLIVTSATWQQASQNNPAWAEIDSGNRLLWRMNRTRLDAESVRDALLAINGKLDLTMGGPSVKQFIELPGVHVTPKLDYANFNVDAPANYRRSVYRFLFRTVPDPFMDALDCADSSQWTPARTSSVTALQALAMLNNRFVLRQCEHLAERTKTMATEIPGQIDALYRLALSRLPTPMERGALADYAARHGLVNSCRLVVNSSEFLFVQ